MKLRRKQRPKPIRAELAARSTTTLRKGETHTIRTTSIRTPQGAVIWRTQLLVGDIDSDTVTIIAWDERVTDDADQHLE